MILKSRRSFLLQRLSLRVEVSGWHVELERTEKLKDEDRRRSTTKSTLTQVDRHACTALSGWPGHKDIRKVTPVLYFQKWCMIGTIKHKEKNVTVPARIIIWCYLPIVVSFILIFHYCFLFFKCLWIYKYVLLMMCSGTKYSHGNFFIHEMFLIFCFFFILVVLIGGWGYRDCSLIVFLLPIKYEEKKRASFHCLFVKQCCYCNLFWDISNSSASYLGCKSLTELLTSQKSLISL